jgi:hypothetical protein
MRPVLRCLSVLLAALLTGLLGVAGGAQMVMGSNGKDTKTDLSFTGVLLGRVTQSPMVPVERADHPVPPGPVVGAHIVISELAGNRVATVVTDMQGWYRVELPPGSYRVEMLRVGRFGVSKDLPASAIVRAGQETRLDVSVDSGIR